MNYYFIEPDVAGGLGKNTIIDRSVHPPIVRQLHFELYGWSGDALVATFPCFLVTEEAKGELECVGVTGVKFDDAEITVSAEFQEFFPQTTLPRFVWLKVHGRPKIDDFGIAVDGRLVVSARAVELLRRVGIPNAVLTLRLA